ncbi:MAG: vWA domain-containing protein [Planctomycetota bacterium]
MRYVPLALLALALGCTTAPERTVPPLPTRSVDPEGRSFVILLDASSSMRQHDPERSAEDAAALALSLLGSRDNVAILAYAEEVEVLVPLGAVGDAASRAALAAQVREFPRDGVTDFVGGLRRARELLEHARAPRGSTLLVLTDGIPYGQRRRFRADARRTQITSGSVEEEAAAILAGGWQIYAVALGAQATTPFLARLVGGTGGSVASVPAASELPQAFTQVAVEALGYLESERDRPSVQVPPDTRRLAFLRPGHSALSAPTLDGEPAPDYVVGPPGAVAVALVEDPAPGDWSTSGEAPIALLETATALRFLPDMPPSNLPGDAEVPVGIELLGESSQLEVQAVRAVLLAGADEDPAGWVSLDAQPHPRYVGHLPPPGAEAEEAYRVVVEVDLVAGERVFTLRRSRSLSVGASSDPQAQGPPPLALTAEATDTQRTAWEGEALDPLEVRLVGDPQRDVTVRCMGEERLVEADQRVRWTLPFPATSQRLVLSARADDGATWEHGVEVQVTRHRLDERPIRFPPRPAGLETETAFDLGLGDLPASPDALHRSSAGAEGSRRDPRGGRLVLLARRAPARIYRGWLEVRASGLRPRRVRVEARSWSGSRAPRADPARRLRLAGRDDRGRLAASGPSPCPSRPGRSSPPSGAARIEPAPRRAPRPSTAGTASPWTPPRVAWRIRCSCPRPPRRHLPRGGDPAGP